ncbi:hypothetical protein [Streptomyces sp. PTD5-9]|uniref:hypothetical protein n=1 Tax=Streptomyces sp. PTD5-9 TaxID=3120150 RepID=UPI00300930A2
MPVPGTGTGPGTGPGTGVRPAPGERLVRELGTRNVLTAVLAVPTGGHVWCRRPGPARDTPLPLPGARPAAAVRAVSAETPVGLALARPHPGQAGVLRYAAPGTRSAAAVLRDDRDPRARAAVRDAVRGLGATLRALHARPVPGAPSGPPPAPARLARWLRAGTGPGAAPRLHAEARARLGDRRLGLIGEWSEASAHGPGPCRLLHGGPALGALVLPAGPGRPVLFTGEELTVGTWEFDVAWQLAEFAEMAAGQRWGVYGPADCTALARAFLEGYGAQPSPAAARRAVVVRSLTHAHDFAAYVAWHDQLFTYLDLVAEAMEAARAPDAEDGWDAARVCAATEDGGGAAGTAARRTAPGARGREVGPRTSGGRMRD